MQLMWVMVETMRGQDESTNKSRRAKSAWKSKRSNALNKPMTSNGPPWIDPVKEKQGDRLVLVGFKVNEDKAKVVQEIYKMAAQGKSIEGIAKTLNDLKIPPITKSEAVCSKLVRGGGHPLRT
jgi:hypothetical protein